jgi:hypothetical protein
MIIMGKSPTSISGVPSLAVETPIAKWLAATSPRPPPMACPLTRATMGLPLFTMASKRSA